VFDSSRFSDTILLGVGNYLISFVGYFAELFNLSVVVWSEFDIDPLGVKLTIYSINLFSNLSL